MDYSFNDFWTAHLAGISPGQNLSALPGWYGNLPHMNSFVPANVVPRPEFSDLSQRVWLIAAPGAVGKSTLAKEICSLTGAVYLDLAEASTVAGNYLIGGLVYTDLLGAWSAGATTIVIDALDEARLRVTQSGFEDFLADVAKVASKGGLPVVLLGRVGIIEEAWLIINENSGIAAPIFDIEFFDMQQANSFVMARLDALATETTSDGLEYPHLSASLASHHAVYEEAVKEVISGISTLSQADADRFVGYAPVLDAVAKVIAAEPNPARINEDMRRVLEGEVLTSLASEILAREAGKLTAQLKNAHADFPDGLYSPDEQLLRLSAQIFGLPAPSVPTVLNQKFAAVYEQAVKNLLPQHPFLNGEGRSASSSVFEASIISFALRSTHSEVRSSAEKYVASAKHTSNPFLFDFYLSQVEGLNEVPAEYLGFLFDSVASKSTKGDKVRLYVTEADTAISSEIIVERNGGKSNHYEVSSPEGGVITLGRRVSGVYIACEHTNVQMGLGGQLEVVPPVSVQCQQLRLACNQVVVKAESKSSSGVMVLLEAEALVSDHSISAPIVRGEAVFRTSWPGSEAYPWTAFSISDVADEASHVSEGLRTLRRLVMAFRSHSKGQLARFRDKIDHFRMLKGRIGEALLQKLIDDGIIWSEGAMYCLDANKLGAFVGVSFQDIQAKEYSARAREYVSNLAL